MARVAFFTFGVLREEWGHPDLTSFENHVGIVFAEAAQAPGFIQLSPAMEQEFIFPRFKRPGRAEGAQTLSLWTDLESVCAFSYHGQAHAEALRRRKEWFVKPHWQNYVAWWVADDHIPDWTEALERFEHLHAHGPTPYAFTFKTPFDADGQATHIAQQVVHRKQEAGT